MLPASPTQQMPSRKRHKKVIAYKGKGGLKEIYTAAKEWSHKPSGKLMMFAGRSLLDMFFPGAGRVAKEAMNLAGWGAYKGSKNTILEASPVPLMHAMPDRGVRIVHREYIGQLSSSVNFTNNRYPINPGLGYVFPWLSGVASSFQKYKLNGLIFYFKNTAAGMVATTNNALGAMIGATQYNPYEAEPASLAEMLNISGSNESKPSEDCVFPLECDKFHSVFPTYFIRDKSVTDDLAKYDPGVFNLAAFGSQAAATVGQLWVAYDITLIQPMPESINDVAMPSGEMECLAKGTIGAGAPYGDVKPEVIYDTSHHYGHTPILVNTSSITLPAMKIPTVFKVEWICYGAEAAATVWPSRVLVNATTVVAAVGSSSINSVISVFQEVYRITDPNLAASVSFTGGSGPAGSLLNVSRVSVELFDGTSWAPSLTVKQKTLLPQKDDDEYESVRIEQPEFKQAVRSKKR